MTDVTQPRLDAPRGLKLLVAVTWRLALVVVVLLLVGSAPIPTPSIAASRRTLAGFDARLRDLSADPKIQRAAQYRLFSAGLAGVSSLVAASAVAEDAPGDVQTVLATDVDDVVIVDWLVSFGAMGAWTAYDPKNPETVFIPVSDVSSLVERSPDQVVVYRLRDKQHLMLVRPVVVGSVTVGAVGFILAQFYEDPALDAAAIQLS